jgi:glycosyltransferase involved in cell wall biosynthesis
MHNSSGHLLPKFSIITVTYNAGKVLEETIQSVISQTYHSIEYLIIDGGSKDNTLDIVNKYKEYIHHLVSEPDKGVYDAMNKGIRLGTGE